MLATSCNELFNILNCICKQFNDIPKVETVLYQQVKQEGVATLRISNVHEDIISPTVRSIQTTYVDAPSSSELSSMKSDEKLGEAPAPVVDEIQEIKNDIQFIITDITCMAEKQLEELQPYTFYLGITFEDLLFDLKRLIFINQIEDELAEKDEYERRYGDSGVDETMTDEELVETIN